MVRGERLGGRTSINYVHEQSSYNEVGGSLDSLERPARLSPAKRLLLLLWRLTGGNFRRPPRGVRCTEPGINLSSPPPPPSLSPSPFPGDSAGLPRESAGIDSVTVTVDRRVPITVNTQPSTL